MNKEIIKAVIEGKIDKSFLKIIDIEKPVFIRTPDSNEFTSSTKENVYSFTESQIISLADCVSEDSYIIIDIGVDE